MILTLRQLRSIILEARGGPPKFQPSDKDRIIALLEKHGNNMAAVARELGVTTPTIRNYVIKFDIQNARRIGSLHHFQRDELIAVLEKHSGNRNATARELGISHTDLAYWMSKFGLRELFPRQRRSQVQRDELIAALEKCGGNRNAAARELGISRMDVVYWMSKFGLRELFPRGSSHVKHGDDSVE